MIQSLYVTVVLLVVIKTTQASKTYEGCQVVRFWPESADDLEVLRAVDRGRYDVWRESVGISTPFDVLLQPHQLELVSDLASYGMSHDVMIPDLQTLIDTTHPLTEETLLSEAKVKVDTDKFYNLSEIYTWLDDEAAVCQYCQVEIYGQTTDGRDLKVMNISRPGSNKKAVWVDSIIHAREWLTAAVSTCFINKLLHDYDTDPEVAELLDNYDWYVVPVVNPDGYEYTWTTDRMWRKTRSLNQNSSCVGTDGNRNYDYQWDGGDTDPCSQIYHGSSVESEPEIIGITDFIEGIASDVALMFNFHTYSQVMLRPWGYTDSDPPDVVELDRLGNIGLDAINANSNVTYTFGQPNGELYGSSFDWAYGGANILYSYTIELRDNGTYGFIAPPEVILPTCNEIWAGVHAMAMDLVSP